MKPSRFSYSRPAELGEALDLLARHPDARVLAGGQSLVPAMNFRLAAPEALIDLADISVLRGLAVADDGALVAGAMTRHAEFERSADVARGWPLIPAVMTQVAHEQIRHRGTIGGSLAHADPAAEWPALCLALDASITVAGPSGERTLTADQFLRGVYATALEPGEMVVRVQFPAWPQERRWGFHEVARRRGDFALAGAMVWLELDDSHCCRAARIVVFGVADRPVSLIRLATRLHGRRIDDEICDEIGFFAAAQIPARSDIHANALYRSTLVEAVVARALRQAGGLSS